MSSDEASSIFIVYACFYSCPVKLEQGIRQFHRQAMGDEVSWRWRWGHLHRSSLKTTIYGRISDFDCFYYGLCLKTDKQLEEKHKLGKVRFSIRNCKTETMSSDEASSIFLFYACFYSCRVKLEQGICHNSSISDNVQTSIEKEYGRCFVATHCLSFTISNRKSYFA
jgi:hypothetical protein